MKLRKGLFMLCAGLSLCACSSDDGNQFPEGTGMVEVKVVTPQPRAIETGSGDTDILVSGDITITLYADFVNSNGTTSNSTTKTTTITAGETAKFWNVKNPTKVTATVNNGKAEYSSTVITDFNPTEPENAIAKESIPAYGEVIPQLTSNSSSPNMNDSDKDKVNANTGDNNKTYQVYTAEINMKIPVARLEVSNLKLSNTSKYSSLTLKGVYLDHINPNGPNWTENEGFTTITGTALDYAYEQNKGTGTEAILKDEVNAEFVNATLPTDSKVYAYYFYGAPEGTQTDNEDTNVTNSATYNPSFKMYFSEGTVKQDEDPASFPRYAFIKRFKDTNGKTVVLENGSVYKIIGADVGLNDENIIGDESGNTLYGVEVTVVQAKWTVKTINADWAQ